MKLFGSSGIRGITNKDVTVDLALKVGLALGKTKGTAVIGRDPRVAGEMIEHAVISGLLSSGCDVVRIGMVSTPTLAYASRDYDCGVMITASHNPAEYVGIKLWNPDGMAFDSSQQEEIEDIIENEKFDPVRWDRIGNLTEDSNAIRKHIEMIVKNVERSSKRVIIDCGCGAGSTITPYVLREIGCEVITLNSQPDGHFPARNPEPNDANLTLLKKAMKEFGADIGIAQDGDADRMMTVDENGDFITGDEMLAMFARHECKSDAKLVVPVDTSMMIDDALPDSTVIRTRVGDVYVAEEIKRSEADFGGEPSGSWIFPAISYCPDGIYAAAKVMELIKEKKLSELKGELPHYPTRRGTVKCDNERKDAVMQLVHSELRSSGEITDIDGIRVDMEEGWVLVRPSGTEPKMRITAEAREGVDKLYDMVENIVKRGLA
ncbi:phosphoglucosamine mutase [Methanococcoides methylutens]|uniref:Probable phosphoglucosamine mutase n=1 Tax=Methanococcoides methylutens TaxID=2226 RepID=A0A099T5G6_METMT|nr:phosphoglucosamine mutase [Methanococcoides methylutens]KGK99403.1 phosphoglucosamine mutase [Methanococcoides methylutens]